MKIYLDTSAYVKGFNEEYRSDVIEAILGKCEQRKLQIVEAIKQIKQKL